MMLRRQQKSMSIMTITSVQKHISWIGAWKPANEIRNKDVKKERKKKAYAEKKLKEDRMKAASANDKTQRRRKKNTDIKPVSRV